MKVVTLFATLLLAITFTFASCKKNEANPPNASFPLTVSCEEGTSKQNTAIIPVTLSTASGDQVSLTWSTSDGTAIAGEDYIAVANSLLVFQPGETVKNMEVKIVNDDLVEADETIFIAVGNPQNALLLGSSSTITITNDDAQDPELSLAATVKATEGSSTQLKAKILVLLSTPSTKEVSLKWSTSDGTAKAGSDFTAVSGATMVFAPGETLKNIEVELVADQVFEFDENFFVEATDVVNATTANLKSKVTIADDDSFTPEIAADGPITPITYPGMQLVWGDEFDGTAVNTEWWSFDIGGGGWGNNELEIYTNSPENASVSGGKLSIVATKTSSGYYSARMVTKGKKEFTYGRIDIRAKMPFGQGIWPALWTLGANISQVGWPACGEIDIMEYLGQETSKTYGTVHYDDGGHKYIGGNYTLPNNQMFNDQFHVFTILWQENSIRWYVDYVKFYEVTSTSVKFDAFRLPQFFIFNEAVGGNWPGNPNATTTFPQTMQVDYVRVFQPE